MTDLSDALARYLIIRRALGYKLQSQEIRLRSFVAFMAHRGESVITSRLAVEWSGLQCGPATWGSRLSTVRAFANHVALSDPRTEVPPFGVFAPQRRPRPYPTADKKNLLSTLVSPVRRVSSSATHSSVAAAISPIIPPLAPTNGPILRRQVKKNCSSNLSPGLPECNPHTEAGSVAATVYRSGFRDARSRTVEGRHVGHINLRRGHDRSVGLIDQRSDSVCANIGPAGIIV
jgi:hypothetical protein